MTDALRPTRELTLAVRAPLHASLSPDGALLTLTTVRVPEGTEDEVDRADRRRRRLRGRDAAARRRSRRPICRVGAGRRTHRVSHRPQRRDDLFGGRRAGVERRADVLEQVPNAWTGHPCGRRTARTIVVACRRGTVIDRTRPYRWTRPFPAADGLGPLEDPPQLRVVDVATGEGRWLTDDDWRWATPRWSPDRQIELAATVAARPHRHARWAVPAARRPRRHGRGSCRSGRSRCRTGLAAGRPTRRSGGRAARSTGGSCGHRSL